MPLKYLCSFWRTLEMQPMLTWSAYCVFSSNAATNQETTFPITDTKFYVPVVTLSTQDNAKILQQLKSGFKRIIIWNKYQARGLRQTRNKNLDYLIDPRFQGVNSQKTFFLPAVEIKE